MTAREQAIAAIRTRLAATKHELAEALNAAHDEQIAALTAQLQTAQATIAEAKGVLLSPNRLDEYGAVPLRWSIRKAREVLSRTDTSALAAVKAEALREAAAQFESDDSPETISSTWAETADWLWQRAASIEQEGAGR